MKTQHRLLAILLLALTPAVTSHARGISWTSGVGDNFLQSDGTSLMDSSFTFELGGFTSGFTPTQANFSLWASNWVIFDLANTVNGQWNPTPGISNYAGSATAVTAGGSNITSSSTGGAFTVGQQAYLWTYNTKSIGGTTQWSLITNTTWLYPTPDPQNPNPLEWTLSDVGNTAVAGATSTDTNTFVSTLQAQPVPEPGSALLIAVAGVMIRLRRRCRR